MTIIKTKINATLRLIRANHAPELEREIQRLIDMGAPTTVHEKIAERVAFSENKFLLDGVESVAVYEWGRDCDQCEVRGVFPRSSRPAIQLLIHSIIHRGFTYV